MGLNLFRANLSMEKEAAKIPPMTGLYRRISFSESNRSTVWKSDIVVVPSITNDSISMSANDKQAQYHLKADLTSKLSSSLIIESEETVVKPRINPSKQPQIRNRAIGNAKASTSIEDPNIKEQSLTRDEESNKINNKNKVLSNITDNELVI